MRFLLDESADGRLGPYLRRLGHDVTTVAHDYYAGLADWQVLQAAHQEGRILIAEDTDFGRLVFVESQPHAGVILFRLGDKAPIETKVGRLAHLLAHHAAELDQFVVVTKTGVRVRT